MTARDVIHDISKEEKERGKWINVRARLPKLLPKPPGDEWLNHRTSKSICFHTIYDREILHGRMIQYDHDSGMPDAISWVSDGNGGAWGSNQVEWWRDDAPDESELPPVVIRPIRWCPKEEDQ
jgi:hypothetical protein